jgi:DNA-binding SARP family transcriptional activator
MVTLQLFGGLTVEGPAGPITGPAVQRKRLALLALLATAPGQGLSRDKLLAYLWPEADPERGRHQLSTSIYEVRKALGEEAILAAGDELRLDPALVRADVAEFEAAFDAGDLARSVELYKGPFADGFFLSGAVEFERWAERERDRLSRRYAKALEGLAEAARDRGDLLGAVGWWRARAAHDPYDSRVAVRLMEALEASGNRAGALQHAGIHERLLREEFGMEPDPEIAELSERLRSSAPESGEAVPTRRQVSAPPRVGSGSARAVDPAPAGAPGGVSLSGSVPGPGAVHRPVLWPRLRRSSTALGLLGLGAAAAMLTAFWLTRPGPTGTGAHRVVVSPFENRTGDSALDPIGRMAADWIARGLSRTGTVEVVLSHDAGAELSISGAYYRSGPTLQIHSQISDAAGTLVTSLEPFTLTPADPSEELQLLGRRMAAAVAVAVDTRLAAVGNLASKPSSYEAYHAFLEGLGSEISGDIGAALSHYERALRLDSTYLFAAIHVAGARMNLGDPAAADSILRRLGESRGRMTPFERAILDQGIAFLSDDRVARYEAAKLASAIGPGSLTNAQWGTEALLLNRPREALRILRAIDPERTAAGGWSHYWSSLTGAHHALGEHRVELRQARRARRLFPDAPWPLLLEGRALAARGRVADLERVLVARRSLPYERSPQLGPMKVALGRELHVRGHSDAAADLFERAIAWYHAQPAEAQVRPAHRSQLGLALLAAERLDEARALFDDLAREDPESMPVQAARGILAARQGDVAEARGIADWLGALRRPYHNGVQVAWRACIVAQLGDHAQAMALLQEAAGRSARFDHIHFCFDPLRDYAPYREFMSPQG